MRHIKVQFRHHADAKLQTNSLDVCELMEVVVRNNDDPLPSSVVLRIISVCERKLR